MRIAHVITDLRLGGAQDNTLITANGQAALGHVVALAAGPFKLRSGEVGAGVGLTTINHLRREVSPGQDLLALREIRRFLNQFRPDVIHTHLSKAGLLARLVAPSRVPIIHTFHTFPFQPLQRLPTYRAYVLMEQLLAKRTGALVAVAPANVTKALAHRIGRPDQFHVIYSALPTAAIGAYSGESRASVRSRLGLHAAGTVIGTVARLVAQKNPLCFVDAAAAIHATHPSATFVVVGDGPLANAMRDRSQHLNLPVIFVGERPDGVAWIRAFDVFVHTSWYEGMGRVIGEAMLCRTPLVVTRVDGVEDAIGGDERGIGVRPNDPTGIAVAVQRILNSPEQTEAMLDRAEAWAHSELAEGKMITGLLSIYTTLLSQDRA